MFASIVVLTICSLSWNSDEQSGLPTSPATPPASRTTLSTVEIQTLKAKAEAGDAKAQLQLGAAYEDGNGVHQNDEQAVNWYRKAAEQGDAEAQNDLGIMYSLGRGVEKSKVEATKWYKRAALQRYPKAMFNMGTAYYNGDGVPVDDTTAYAWFLLAQEAGSQPAADAVKRAESEMRRFQKVEAFSKIGEMYEKGEDLRQDYVEAAKWYRKAAEAGDAPARVRLAGILVQDRSGTGGYEEARHWCEQAAKQNYSPGAYCVGLLYERGLGVPTDVGQAAKWYSRAADMGHAFALLRLGEMYWKGTGVKADKVAAYTLVLLASTADLPDAERDKTLLEKEMDSKQVQKARQKAVEWTRNHPLLGLRKKTPSN
jgi:uncharacterized protein